MNRKQVLRARTARCYSNQCPPTMNKNKHSSSVVTRTGALTTPFASRGSRAECSMHRSMVNRSLYSPLTDPHLKHFFRQKLISGLSRSEKRPSSRYGTPTHTRPLSAPTQHKTPPSASYKVTVRTGSSKDSGTSSKIFLTLAGVRGKILRQRLTKGGQKDFLFKPGSLETFRLRGCDIGELRYVVVENEGLRESDGWLLDNISVTSEQRDKWTCPCNQWLSLHRTDCQLTRKCKARPYTSAPTQPPQPTTYSLEVHTGNVRGAGTAANVFVSLSGTKGSSGKTQLSGDFDRGSVVTASVCCESDLGRLRTITVEHDNSGFGPDWLLDYIALIHGDTVLFFHCAQWLSRNEGDGIIHRTLHATLDPPKPFVGRTYIVTIQTGNLRGAGTDANVYITLRGSEGSGGEKRLDNDPANFERGRQDVFSVHCHDLGELTKVKVRHDNTGLNPGWLLDSVSVACEGVEVCFTCGRWLEVCDGCGGVLEVELTAGEKESEAKQENGSYQYKVQATTGNRPGSSTSANVYIVLHGSHGDSGRLWLSSGGRSFQSGGVNEFDVVSRCDVGDLEMVRVGHDNSGVGPGWFLEELTVRCVSTGSQWKFPCGRWLCMDSGDGRIERELHPLVAETSAEERGKWTVHMYTSDIRGAGTDANVTIQVHGSHGDSNVIPIGDGIANFEQGEHDIFRDVPVCEGVGCVDSVTVTHDGTRPYPDWHLHKVTLVNQATGEEYVCLCDRWLTAGKDETGTKVRLAAIQQHPKQTVSSEGNDLGATPTKGDATPTYLSDEFESSGEDTCSSPPVIEISSYQEMDSSITNQYVKQLRYEQMSSVETSNLRNSSTEATQSYTVDFDSIPYTVHVVAGSPPACDPAPFLIITLVGSTHSSQPIRLERINTGQFVSGRPETFSVESENVGSISSMKVTLEAPPHCSPWLIEEVNIHSPTLGHTYHFIWGRGMHPGREYTIDVVDQLLSNSRSTVANSPQPQDAPGLVAYEVKVSTADKKQAGTKNNLHLILTGEQGSSKPLTIKNHSMFQRGQTDTFQIATPPLGELKSIKIAHSPRKGRVHEGASEWYLFQIVITCLSDVQKYSFLCRRWIPESSSTLHYIELTESSTS